MDTEETTPPKSKKFLKIALITVTVLATLLGVAFFLTALKNAKQAAEQALSTALEPPRELTEAEKLAKAQSEELDKLRTAHQATTTPSSTTTLKTQVKSIDTIRNQTLKQTTIVTPKKTVEQQNKELDALRSAILNK